MSKLISFALKRRENGATSPQFLLSGSDVFFAAGCAMESAPVDLDVRCLSGEGCKMRVRPILLGRELLGTRWGPGNCCSCKVPQVVGQVAKGHFKKVWVCLGVWSISPTYQETELERHLLVGMWLGPRKRLCFGGGPAGNFMGIQWSVSYLAARRKGALIGALVLSIVPAKWRASWCSACLSAKTSRACASII